MKTYSITVLLGRGHVKLCVQRKEVETKIVYLYVDKKFAKMDELENVSNAQYSNAHKSLV